MIVRGLESAAKGMVALMDMNDRIANNLSNVNTVGFKKGELRFKDVMESAVYSQEGSILRNDTFVEDMAAVLDEVRKEIGDEKYDELIDSLVAYGDKMKIEIAKAKAGQ